jgi:ribosomal 50S subunit-recycling heat shock protein
MEKNMIIFFFLLEARLDVVMFRACFFSSIKSARQWINHNKILVNNQFINTSSYRLKPGDIISIKPKDRILLCRKIMHFLKKSFFKQNKNTPKQFSISTFLFKKLKSSLKPSGNTQSLIDHFKKNSLYLNYLSDQFREMQPLPLAYWSSPQVKTKTKAPVALPVTARVAAKGTSVLLATAKENQMKFDNLTLSGLGRSTEDTFSVKKNLNKQAYLNMTYPHSILNYKQFLFQVKQVLRFVLNKYSNKNRYLKNTNSFALHLSHIEKSTLISNLIELELLEKRNLESLEGLRGFLIHLKLKKLFFKSEKKKKSFTILNQNVLKPLNLEISYKSLVIIYLYPPQKITFACSIDMELISRSLA